MNYVLGYGTIPFVCAVESCSIQTTNILDNWVEDASCNSQEYACAGDMYLGNTQIGIGDSIEEEAEATTAYWNCRIPDINDECMGLSGGDSCVGGTTALGGVGGAWLSHHNPGSSNEGGIVSQATRKRRSSNESCGQTSDNRAEKKGHSSRRAPKSYGVILNGRLVDAGSIKKGTQASRFCHICLRRAEKVKMVVCSRLLRGACRKVVCKICFGQFGLDWEGATREDEEWECTHCRQT